MARTRLAHTSILGRSRPFAGVRAVAASALALLAAFATGCADATSASRSEASPGVVGSAGTSVVSPRGTSASDSSVEGPVASSAGASATPAPSVTENAMTPLSTGSAPSTLLATFGAGCFWGPEAKFRKIDGVVDSAVGYAGGRTESPTYKEVCYEETGHAEVVQVEYDPAKVSYQALVDAFFAMHDPTQLNRQGPDVGDQYRTVIFYHSPEQERIARDTIQRLTEAKRYRRPIVTQVLPAPTFWRAEEYHQQYLKKRGLETCAH
jgi:peptide-methionine (S)-S-oxide reductase